MQGKIEDFSVPDIFRWISSQGKSGSLNISFEDCSTDFFFSEGRIVDVQPIQPVRGYYSLLGIMLRDAGYITDGELRHVLEVMEKGEGKKIGDVLVEQEIVPKDMVSRYLALQIKEGLFNVLTYKAGRYKFEGFTVRPASWGGEPIHPDVLIMQGMRFLDEHPVLRGKFPQGDFRAIRKTGASVDTDLFSDDERAVWKALAFSDEPAKVFRKACMTVLEGFRTLSALYDLGLLEIELASPPEVDASRRVRDKIRRLKAEGVIRAALWVGVAALVFPWLRKLLISPDSVQFFTSWMRFFR